jgi:hypothetical protein
MRMIVCDLCPPKDMVKALYHIEFWRIPPAGSKGMEDNKADRPVDLCQMHYDATFEYMMGMATHA